MCKIICVTNRKICDDDFFKRVDEIAANGVEAIILREKDMITDEYKILAARVIEICEKRNTLCILHSFTEVAKEISHHAIHLPFARLKSLEERERKYYKILGASCHSVEEAIEAEKLGCTYIVAGHIFKTDCKKGADPRGVEFLEKVCKSVDIPVYGIGGINNKNIGLVTNAGAEGVCIMSGFMKHDWKENIYEI